LTLTQTGGLGMATMVTANCGMLGNMMATRAPAPALVCNQAGGWPASTRGRSLGAASHGNQHFAGVGLMNFRAAQICIVQRHGVPERPRDSSETMVLSHVLLDRVCDWRWAPAYGALPSKAERRRDDAHLRITGAVFAAEVRVVA
jgi:hypothetical protein